MASNSCRSANVTRSAHGSGRGPKTTDAVSRPCHYCGFEMARDRSKLGAARDRSSETDRHGRRRGKLSFGAPEGLCQPADRSFDMTLVWHAKAQQNHFITQSDSV